MHKDKLLCIFSQIKNNAYLPVHLVHAPSFTLLLLVFCVFSFSFCMLFVISVSVFFASSLSLDFPIFRFWAYLMKVIPETRCALNLMSKFYYYYWFDITGVGLLVPEGIIHPVVSAASALTWFNRYMYYWNLQFQNNKSIIKIKVLLPQV